MPPSGGTRSSLATYSWGNYGPNGRGTGQGATPQQQLVEPRFAPVFQPQGAGAMFAPSYPLVPPDYERLRRLNYPVGYNYIYTPRAYEPVGFDELQSLANSHDITRLAIETRKDQIESLDWQIQPKDVKGATKAQMKRAEAREKFWEHPDGYTPFATWLRELLEDLFVIDAATLEVRRTRGGEIIGLDVIAGKTIKVLIDETGRRPRPPAPAYEQIIHGRPWVLTEDGRRVDPQEDKGKPLFDSQIVYMPRNPRPDHIYGYCFAPDTEILTEDGWKLIAALGFKDRLATRNPVSKAFEWQAPVALTTRSYQGDLIHFKAKALDVLVTPEHHMIVKNRRGDGREMLMPAGSILKSGHVRTHFQIPVACQGNWCGKRIIEKRFGDLEKVKERNRRVVTLRASGGTYQSIAGEVGVSPMTAHDIVAGRYRYDGSHQRQVELSGDDYCAFMGMYLSEGSIGKGGRFVCITQTKTPTRAKFIAALTKMFGMIGTDASALYVHRSALAKHLKIFGRSPSRFVPEDIMGATTEQIALFLEYLIDGDGHRSPKGGIYYYTTSKRLADQVQELAQKIGKSATIHRMPLDRAATMRDGRIVRSRRQQYRVTIGNRQYLSAEIKPVPFDGVVFCVSVPNKSVYVRRNGLAAWTSQSPVEQILMTVNTALRRQVQQLQWFTDGNVPAGLLTAPDGWNMATLAESEERWNAYLQGNTAERSKMPWAPFGVKYQAFKDPPLKDEFDEWLARVVMYAFSLPPTAFTKQINRGETEAVKESAMREGLEPIKRWVVRLINNVERRAGNDDLTFAWAEEEALDAKDQSEVLVSFVKEGIKTRNEAREILGDDPVDGGDVLMVDTASGPMRVIDAAEPPVLVEPVQEPDTSRGPRSPKSQAAGNPKKPAGEAASRAKKVAGFSKAATMTQADAGYTMTGAKERCRDCSMFRAPDACTLVRGDISPEGHCDYWQASGKAAVAASLRKGAIDRGGAIDPENAIPVTLPVADDETRAEVDHRAWDWVRHEPGLPLVRLVSVADLVATQPVVDAAKVAKHAADWIASAGGGFAEPPIVLLLAGLCYILDGHHHVEGAKRAGASALPCQVVPGDDVWQEGDLGARLEAQLAGLRMVA